MKTIIPNQTFKHETEIYRDGQEYEVSDEDAEYFSANGWVGEQGDLGKAQLLNIHDMQLGHSAEVN